MPTDVEDTTEEDTGVGVVMPGVTVEVVVVVEIWVDPEEDIVRIYPEILCF